MKILMYNWIPFDEQIKGGGVTVYTRNLINALEKKYTDIELSFLCAGSYHDTNDTSIRYEEIKLNYETKCKAFTIVNSPVFAPAYLAFYHVKSLLNDFALRDVFIDFLHKEGPFDVIHFQNLEGLSLNAFSCKSEFPQTKFIYSIHNYYAFCPRVDLWKNNSENCSCVNTGLQCMDCMICHVPAKKLSKKMEMNYELRKDFSEEKKNEFDAIGKELDTRYRDEEIRELSRNEKEQISKYLSEYRVCLVEAINTNMDCVLAVSKRVAEIAINCGIKTELINVSYIGTEVASIAINKYKGRISTPLTLIYMGYQNTEKGFFFLLDVLDKLSPNVSRKLNLMIVARGNAYTKDLLDMHRKKFNTVIYKEGYLRDEIPYLLKSADVGIVPVLWEDNLPQVAIEMVAYGVPIICSDRGGAKELTNNLDFVFKAGDVDDCVSKLEKIISNPEILERYFINYLGLTTMEKHIEELMKHYNY